MQRELGGRLVVLAQVVGRTEELEVSGPVRSAARKRRDVVNVEPAVGGLLAEAFSTPCALATLPVPERHNIARRVRSGGAPQ